MFFVLFFCVSLGFLAAEERSLSVREGIDLALQHNLDLRIQERVLDHLYWTNVWGWTALSPSVVGTGSLIRSNVAPGATLLNPDASPWSLSGDLSLTTPLGPTLIQNILIVFGKSLDLKKGRITYRKAIKTVVSEVHKIYFDLLIAQESRNILESQLEVVLRQNKDLKSSYDAGLIDEYVYLQSELQKIQLEQRINSQKNIIESLEDSLSFILGQEEDTSYVLSDSIPELNTELIQTFYEKIDTENNYDLQVEEINKFILRISATASALSLLPKVGLAWNTGRTFLRPISEEWFNDSNWGADTGNLAISLSWSLSNLLPGSAPFAASLGIQRDRDNNELLLERSKQTLRRQLINLQNSLRFNVESLELSQVQRDLAKKAFEIISGQYDSGLAQYTQLQEAENDQLDAEQNYLSQTVVVLKNLLDINFLLGEDDDVTFYE